MSRQASTSIDIAAAPELIWRQLTELERYRNWNSRTHFNSPPHIGKSQLMRVRLFGLWLPVPVRILHCSPEEGLRWIGGIPLLYTGSHFFKLSPGEGHTTLTQGEDFKGLLVPLLWPLIRRELYGLYVGFNREIRLLCENSPARET